jgi:FkbM family methyltransferase
MVNLTEMIHERGDYWWPVHDIGCWDYMHKHADVPQRLAEITKNKGVVVQAGGNAGFYIKQYAELFDTVYTFEPDPLCFLCLTLNCDSPNVVKFQSCVGNKSGFVDVKGWESDIGATHISGKGRIPTMRIDDLDLEQCDLIQLDTEGFEYYGLLGAENTIKKYRPVISVEWYEEWGARYGVTLEMIENLLASWNYKMVADYDSDRVYVPQ